MSNVSEPSEPAGGPDDSSGGAGTWRVSEESTISLKTSRIGLLSVHAHAPVIEGTARIDNGEVSLEFVVAIDRVSTGNPLLDPEVHALVRSGSDGTLVFSGTGEGLEGVAGHATAGNVTVPLELGASVEGDPGDRMDLDVRGTTRFENIHVPLPGMGHIHHVDVDISGLINLMRETAES